MSIAKDMNSSATNIPAMSVKYWEHSKHVLVHQLYDIYIHVY